MKKYIALTVLYIVMLVAVVGYFDKVPSTANEWGDYFAGFVAPVALAWFIGTLSLQRKELGLQRKELELQRREMELTRGVLEEQSATQLKTAEAMLEANKIAASTLFAESVTRHEDLLDQYLENIGKLMPQSLNTPNGRLVGLERPNNIPNALEYFDLLLAQGVGAEDEQFNDRHRGALLMYERTFFNFREQAYEADRVIDLFGPHHELWGKVRAFLGEGEA
jgi:hypothetical protein